jgi:hypothetical protein
MKSRYVNPQVQNETVEHNTPDVNPPIGVLNSDEPDETVIPADLPPPEKVIVTKPNQHSSPDAGASHTTPSTQTTVAKKHEVTKSPARPVEQKKPTVPVVKKTTTPPSRTETPVTSFIDFLPLLWEKSVVAAKGWTQIIYSVIRKDESYLLGQNVADDIEIFCPNYRNLNESQRLNFWGQFFASLAYHESGWNPVSRMVEANFTKPDSVTKMPVASEGLLQLSYQDENSYRLDCGFDWSKDKNLALKDPKKTILDPYNNLRCGIKIMSYQLKKYRLITMSSNVYWAVLKTNGVGSKISQISESTRSLKICQNN